MPHKRKADKVSQRQDRKKIYRVTTVVRELLAVAFETNTSLDDVSADQRREAVEFLADVASEDHATCASKSRPAASARHRLPALSKITVRK